MQLSNKSITLTVFVFGCLLNTFFFSCTKNYNPSPKPTQESTYGFTRTLRQSGFNTATFNNNALVFNSSGIAIDSFGNIYATLATVSTIKKITPDGVVSTFTDSGQSGSGPFNLTVDSQNNLYVTYSNSDLIRIIAPTGIPSTFAGDFFGGLVNGLRTSARFNGPSGMTIDKQNNMYVADYYNQMIRKIDYNGVVTIFAGSGQFGMNNGPGASATFHFPYGTAVDTSGNVYVTDQDNNSVRKITKFGVVTTLAGNGAKGAVNGNGVNANFNNPLGIAVDIKGNVYVADAGNNLIRKISPNGTVTTLAGTGDKGATDGSGLTASFNFPWGLTIDKTGNLYVADVGNLAIRKISTN